MLNHACGKKNEYTCETYVKTTFCSRVIALRACSNQKWLFGLIQMHGEGFYHLLSNFQWPLLICTFRVHILGSVISPLFKGKDFGGQTSTVFIWSMNCVMAEGTPHIKCFFYKNDCSPCTALAELNAPMQHEWLTWLTDSILYKEGKAYCYCKHGKGA